MASREDATTAVQGPLTPAFTVRRRLKGWHGWHLLLQGAGKTEVLKSFGANIFFDDQDIHGLGASKVVPSARVPYKKGQEPK